MLMNITSPKVGWTHNRPKQAKQFSIGQLLPRGMHGLPAWTDWDMQKGITEGFEFDEVVYACVRLYMMACSEPSWVVRRRVGNDWEVDNTHPVNQLISKPNSFQSWTAHIQRTVSHMKLGGRSLWTKIKDDDVDPPGVVSLWAIDPWPARPVLIKDTQLISHYEYGEDSKPIPAQLLIRIQQEHPGRPWDGMSDLQGCAKVVDTHNLATSYQFNSFENRGDPSGAFMFDAKVTRQDIEELKELAKDQILGVDNARLPLFLGSNAKYERTGVTPVELDFNTSEINLAKRICRAFFVPPPLIGIMDDATLANFDSSQKLFRWTCGFVLKTIESEINQDEDLFPISERGKVQARWTRSELLPAETGLGEQIDQFSKLVGDGVPAQQAAELVGINLTEYEGWDVSMVNATRQPLSRVLGTENRSDIEFEEV